MKPFLQKFPTEPLLPLSKKQRRVLRMLADGHSIASARRALRRGRGTLEKHTEAIRLKFGLRGPLCLRRFADSCACAIYLSRTPAGGRPRKTKRERKAAA